MPWADAPSSPRALHGRLAVVEGFSLHADTGGHAHDTEGLARLARYGARGPLASSRVTLRFVAEAGKMRFEELGPPTQGEVERLLSRVRRRVLRLLEKRGALPAQGPEDALQAYQEHSLRQRLFWPQVLVRPRRESSPGALCLRASACTPTHTCMPTTGRGWSGCAATERGR